MSVDGSGDRMFMHTVGVDLSVSRRRTAVVSVEWGGEVATVGLPRVGLADEALVQAVADAEWVGISAPFGWPSGMVSALHAYMSRGEWCGVDKVRFRYRATDVCVHEYLLQELGRKVWPLSVSSDGVALRAWRLARLREEVAERTGVRFDRAGADGVVEVFPGAALLLWGFERGVYRQGEGSRGDEGIRKVREEFLAGVEAIAPWLRWSGDARAVCVGNEDAVDAVISALVVRAVSLGVVKGVENGVEDVARTEGWVYLPEEGSLRDLVGDVACVEG